MLIKCKKCGLVFDGSKETAYCADCRHTIKSASVVRPRTCRTCGITFDGGPRAWYCPECRRARQLKSDIEGHQRVRLGTTRKLGSIDLCTNCGKEYTVNSARQKYCPDCADQCVRSTVNTHKRAYMQASAADNYARKTERYKDRRVCVVCGKLLQTLRRVTPNTARMSAGRSEIENTMLNEEPIRRRVNNDLHTIPRDRYLA